MYQVETNTLQKIWDEILNKIKLEIDVNAYNTFFLPLVAKEIRNSKLIVEAPSRFVKEVISSETFSLKRKIRN